MTAGTSGVSAGIDRPAVHLVRLGAPATVATAAAVTAARRDMAARMAPELRVTDLEIGVDWTDVASVLDESGEDLPWALLALPSAGPAVITIARKATALGRPPSCVLVRVEDETTLRAELTYDADFASGSLTCPVAILVTTRESDPADLGGWHGLSTGEITVRLLAPDESLDDIARTVKEELKVWPA